MSEWDRHLETKEIRDSLAKIRTSLRSMLKQMRENRWKREIMDMEREINEDES